VKKIDDEDVHALIQEIAGLLDEFAKRALLDLLPAERSFNQNRVQYAFYAGERQ